MRKMKKRYELLIYVFITFCCFIGIWLGTKLIGEQLPSGNYLLLFILVGALCGVGLPMLISWSNRRSRQPDMDERTVRMLKNYLLSAFFLVSFLSGVLLLVLVGIGHETIELGWIAVYGGAIFILMTAGLFVVKRF
ncbi:hypothetical protein CHH49_12290 [Terribacillus saccharophilus]|uniref:hypothetical protein n=1 Tax=Terribacillus saccharophilus TaxID=361277 RepID=UPI000BA7D689|nr:hypothetical protein [Terribacillus saccharophilus]PAF21197.1 hypothetical protein CHH49_12290 [Terribacillus saccharophilus]